MRISDWSSDVCSSDLCLCISLELRLQRFAESNGLGSNDMHQRTALQTGEYRRIDLLGNGFIIGQHHAATRTAQSLRSEEHTSELQSLMRISYAVFCLKKKNTNQNTHNNRTTITPTTK